VSTAAGVKSSSIFCLFSAAGTASASPSSHERLRVFFCGSSLVGATCGAGRSKSAGLNLTIIAVMLSQPVPSPTVLGARQLWKSYRTKNQTDINHCHCRQNFFFMLTSSQISANVNFPASMRCLTNPTTSSLLM
jgi:hypothetical protein